MSAVSDAIRQLESGAPTEPVPMSVTLARVLEVVRELEAHGHTVQTVEIAWHDEMPYVGVSEPNGLHPDGDLVCAQIYRDIEIGWPSTAGEVSDD
jgi:hypothetical protein